MIFWLALGAMTALAVVIILGPLLRRPSPAAARRAFDLEVYRAQLAELEREQERGLLAPEEAAAARLEIERRLLAADADLRRRRAAPSAPGKHRFAAAVILIGFLGATGALYGLLGSPGLPGQPFAQRADDRATTAGAERSGAAGLPSVETMIARLRERVAANPTDLEGWSRLGRAHALAGQFEAAAEAYRRAITLRDDVPELHAALGETLVMAQDGIVTAPASAAFGRALELEPAEPRARFYQGLALAQRGELQAALDAWVALARDTPDDAAWLSDLRARIAALAEELGEDVAALLPDTPAAPEGEGPDGAERGPTPEQLRAARDLSPEAQADMIRDMVAGLAARLEAEPDDVEGWRMLARSYRVLDQPARAAEAYGEVARLLPGDLDAQLDYAHALLAARGADQLLSAELVEQLQRVHALDQDQPDALFYLGRAAAEDGDPLAAARYWETLLAQLPADGAERAQLQRLIDQLPVRN